MTDNLHEDRALVLVGIISGVTYAFWCNKNTLTPESDWFNILTTKVGNRTVYNMEEWQNAVRNKK